MLFRKVIGPAKKFETKMKKIGANQGVVFCQESHRSCEKFCNKNEKIIEANHQKSICQKGYRSCKKFDAKMKKKCSTS